MIFGIMNQFAEYNDIDMENSSFNTYRRKYQLLLERCEVLQQDNERLVHRIQHVRKMLRRYRKERKFLMDRLDSHRDNWRNVPLTFPLEDLKSNPQIKIEKTEKQDKNNTNALKSTSKSNSKSEKTPRKRRSSVKGEKAEKDPNAPKRPANPFFQFCQEQRPIVMERLGMEQRSLTNDTHSEPSKQELTRQLATQWNTLPPEDKKVYHDMYLKSKEKYKYEMDNYSRGKIIEERHQ